MFIVKETKQNNTKWKHQKDEKQMTNGKQREQENKRREEMKKAVRMIEVIL